MTPTELSFKEPLAGMCRRVPFRHRSRRLQWSGIHQHLSTAGLVERKFFMARKPNTNRQGGSFSDSERWAVWQKGAVVTGYDPNVFRRDRCGAWIEWSQFGVTTPRGRGWEIDHDRPVSHGGSDSLDNLQPLQWENNRHKSDSWPHWSCNVNVA